MTASEHPEAPPAERRTPWMVIVSGVVAGSVLLTTFVQFHNTRTLISWHGFLHTAIANRFPGPFGTPENPFFAGEPLPYYWFHHYVASSIGRAFDIHPIYVFPIITAIGLAVLWIGSAAIGVYRFRSLKAGLMVGFLLLAGVNPLGPVIALGKHVVQGQPLMTPAPPMSSVETVFVSDRESDELMTQPLLGALYATADWRRGQNVPWYVDISSRGIGLALICPLLLVFMGGALSWTSGLSIGAIAAVMTAFNPLIGLAVVGALVGGSIVVALLNRIWPGAAAAQPAPSTLGLAVAAVIGAAVASPTFYHLFLVGGSVMQVPPLRTILMTAFALGLNVIVLLPLALWGCLRTTDTFCDQYRVLVIGACALLCIVPLISLPDDTEHNVANTAQCLLVSPAVALVAAKRLPRLTNVVVVTLFVPMTVATLASYLGRPSLPVAFEGGVMHRTRDEALERLYRWARASTAPGAVFVADPSIAVKMSGNVAELPAFTGRTLFVDHASYLTTPYTDFERRRDIATRLTEGFAISEQDVPYLATLRRPVYLVSYRADQPELRDRLIQRYGTPAFADGFVAAFDLTTRLEHLDR